MKPLILIKTEKADKLINLSNVSTITLDNNKIIYNFFDSIDILGRETPDYVYQYFDSINEAKEFFEDLKTKNYIKDNFIWSNKSNNRKELINTNFITNISVIEDELKIVFNLSYSITILDKKTNKRKKVSKFVYWKYNDLKTLEKELKEVLSNNFNIL